MSFTYFRMHVDCRTIGNFSTQALAEEAKERYLSTKPVFGGWERPNTLVADDDVSIIKITVDVDDCMFSEVGADPEYKRMRQAKVDAEIANLEEQLTILRSKKVLIS